MISELCSPFSVATFCFRAVRSSGSPSSAPYRLVPTSTTAACAATSASDGGGQCTMPCARLNTSVLPRSICCIFTMHGVSVCWMRCERRDDITARPRVMSRLSASASALLHG
eukprot:CAMPEP_0181182630 /NCGR_PEP_ID=MMETSP1096-20121128/7994_1 /TAXON_ID=156174 ORGANISM="Chrysochromulina ericina, Strain CCMP281" /NCGR_SAMPLE_ID=MMETSP1096 /ASSEMBLY_ACC=CAM_ASM_000453 /LENGTH=111 /DNA_ID=CAMNT_0023271255 /DNA_START=31 /DNA_END=362 /DNA_ORIENTATION=+